MTGRRARRRDVLASLAAWALAGTLGWTGRSRAAAGARVAIVGGGFGGATAARYLRRLAPGIAVTLFEPRRTYLTCPHSNEVIGGLAEFGSLRHGYASLRDRDGVDVRHERVLALVAARREVVTRAGRSGWDRLVVAPGIRLRWGAPEGYDEAAALRMPHAWKAGAQTLLLRRQLEALPAGGVIAITVPPRPFRCPPGPYERASLVARWCRAHRPRAKVLVLDANADFSKQALFLEAWEALYPGLIEWVPIDRDGAVRRVDPGAMTVHTELEDHRVDVANVIPAQGAAALAVAAGLVDATGWCPVDALTFESARVPGVHVIGDAATAGAMPKSASAANSQGKLAAVAIAALLAGETPPAPSLHNTCYSLVDADYGISVSMIYRVLEGGIVPVEGAGGTSPVGAPRARRHAEARYARDWLDSITRDTFGG